MKALKFIIVFIWIALLFSLCIVGITNNDPETDNYYGKRIHWGLEIGEE